MTIYYGAAGWQIADEAPEGAVEVSTALYTSLMGKECEPGPSGQPRATAAQRRADLLAAATAKRWEVETGGITMPNGVSVATAKADQDRVTSVIANAELAGVTSVDFKAASGWVTLNMVSVRLIAKAISLHVQACFSTERAHHEAIAALADAELDAYDLNTGWPVQTLNLGALA